MSIDPLAGSARQPQTLNRYAYVAGNPLNFVDPTGMQKNNCWIWVTQVAQTWAVFDDGSVSALNEIHLWITCIGTGSGGGAAGGWADRGPRRDPRVPPSPDPNPDPDPNPEDPNGGVKLTPVQDFLSSLDIDGLDYANCVSDNRVDWGATAYSVLNPVANFLAGDTGRSGFGSSRHPTSWQHKVGAWASRRTGWIGFSRAGKFLGRASVLLTIGEGFVDLGVLAGCAIANNLPSVATLGQEVRWDLWRSSC